MFDEINPKDHKKNQIIIIITQRSPLKIFLAIKINQKGRSKEALLLYPQELDESWRVKFKNYIKNIKLRGQNIIR